MTVLQKNFSGGRTRSRWQNPQELGHYSISRNNYSEITRINLVQASNNRLQSHVESFSGNSSFTAFIMFGWGVGGRSACIRRCADSSKTQALIICCLLTFIWYTKCITCSDRRQPSDWRVRGIKMDS